MFSIMARAAFKRNIAAGFPGEILSALKTLCPLPVKYHPSSLLKKVHSGHNRIHGNSMSTLRCIVHYITSTASFSTQPQSSASTTVQPIYPPVIHPTSSW